MAEFYSARGWEIPPLPWTNLSPPFSIDRAPKTLAMWRMQGIGPGSTKVGGRVIYKKSDLDHYLSGEEAA